MPTSTYDLIASNVLGSSAASDCIPFDGYVDKGTGYGVKRHKGKLVKAHRLAYILTYGEIDKALHVDHTCHNEAVANGTCEGGACEHRRCINPEHLRAVTASENHKAGAHGLDSKTHCSNGHNLAEVGLIIYGKIRTCSACRRTATIAAKARYRAKKRGQ